LYGDQPATRTVDYRVTFAVLALAATTFCLLLSMVIPAIPQFERSLHSSAGSTSWLLTAYILCAAVFTPIIGRVGDMVGKQKTLFAVLIALSLGGLICALATSLPVMILGRAVQGAGGSVFPLSFGIIRDEFPPHRVAWAVGIMSAILGAGSGLGIVLAGPIIDHFNYHWLFWFPLILAVTAAVATFVFVPESPVRARVGLDWLGAVLMAGWLVTALLAMTYGPSWGWTDPAVLALFGASALLLVLWVWFENRSSVPLVDMEMMRVPVVRGTNLAGLLFGFGTFAMFVTVPKFVETPSRVGYGFGASVTEAGLFLLPFALAMLVAAPLTGRLTAVIGSRALLVAASLLSAASYLLLAVAHRSPWDIYLASGTFGVGLAWGYAGMTNLIIEGVRADQTGVATGMSTTIRNIGSALGAGVSSSIILSDVTISGLARLPAFVLVFVVTAGVMVVAALVAARIPGGKRPATEPTATAALRRSREELGVGVVASVPDEGA
jgi:MFS family permease